MKAEPLRIVEWRDAHLTGGLLTCWITSVQAEDTTKS